MQLWEKLTTPMSPMSTKLQLLALSVPGYQTANPPYPSRAYPQRVS